jgi:hypothetical protein
MASAIRRRPDSFSSARRVRALAIGGYAAAVHASAFAFMASGLADGFEVAVMLVVAPCVLLLGVSSMFVIHEISTSLWKPVGVAKELWGLFRGDPGTALYEASGLRRRWRVLQRTAPIAYIVSFSIAVLTLVAAPFRMGAL